MQRIYEESNEENALLIPVIPLILGGDDLFVAMVTPYCLDFARRFAQEFTRLMSEKLSDIGLTDFEPSICCGLVITKATYPYTLAHKHATSHLSVAKSVARSGNDRNLISFGFGGEEVASGSNNRYSDTLCPYSLEDKVSNSSLLPLKTLLDARFLLRDIPASRLAQFQALYDIVICLLLSATRMLVKQVRFLFDRTGRNPDHRDKLEQVLFSLGSTNEDYLYMRQNSRFGLYSTGLLDLLVFGSMLWISCVRQGDYEYER